jgi:hypothetical protein
MELSEEGKLVRTDIWREGKYLDLWSVVHFLTGISTALGLSAFHFGFLPSVIIALVSFVAYEMWEAMVKIKETPQNRFLDVVVGMASYVPTALYVAPLFTSFASLAEVFGIVLIANIALAYVGWSASQKAKALETRLYTEFEFRKARRKARRLEKRAQRAAGTSARLS